MPSSPPHPCAHPGCRKIVSAPRCEEHQAIADERRRERDRIFAASREKGTANDDRFYKSKRWVKIRKIHIASEPLCRSCSDKGRVVLATEVDHILPIRSGGSKDDPDNLQSLCKPCHSRKTAREVNERKRNDKD